MLVQVPWCPDREEEWRAGPGWSEQGIPYRPARTLHTTNMTLAGNYDREHLPDSPALFHEFLKTRYPWPQPVQRDVSPQQSSRGEC